MRAPRMGIFLYKNLKRLSTAYPRLCRATFDNFKVASIIAVHVETNKTYGAKLKPPSFDACSAAPERAVFCFHMRVLNFDNLKE